MSKWKFTQIEPQPARGTLVESMWDDPMYVAEEKFDGDRRIAQFCGRQIRFTGRRKSVKDGLFVEKTENVPHLSCSNAVHCRDAGGVPVPAALDGTVLDGEMIYPVEAGGVFAPDGTRLGGLSKHVTSIMGSLPAEAIQKQIERGWLRYVVFDILYHRGADVRWMKWEERRELAGEAVREWGNPFATTATFTIGKKRKYYEDVVARGGEGVILKHCEHRYGDKRGWIKVKKQATADCVIMGYKSAKEMSKKVNGEESITKYAKAGLIGAVVVGQYLPKRNGKAVSDRGESDLVEVATISGMDDKLRAELTKNGDKYLGKVVRIEHNGREPTGRFRHPRWDGIRKDKSPRDCIFDLGES